MGVKKSPFSRNISETAEYFSNLVRRECSPPTTDQEYLIEAFRTLAWAAEQLEGKKRCENIYNRLEEVCEHIACRLIDVAVVAHLKRTKNK